LLLGGFTVTGIVGCGLLMLTGRTLATENMVRLRTGELEFEINERKRIIQQRDSQNQVLRAVVSQEPLAGVLKLIVEITEKNNPGVMGSILLLDESGKRLRHGAAVSLPAAYNAALDGFEIGPGRGSCGNAAYTGQLTVAENVFQHPHWRNYHTLARQAGIASCWAVPIFSSSGQVLGTFAMYSRETATPSPDDIAWVNELSQIASIAIERKNAEEYIMRLGYYDSLTDLPNRRLLLEHLDKELARIVRQDGYDAVLFLDLDHFKTLNDALGHEIGDELLRQVAQRLRQCIREEDTAARLGGDEFVVLLCGSAADAENIDSLALNLGQRIQETLGMPYMLQGYEHHVTPSIGISVFPQGQTSANEILRQADTAMYSAKTGGRNTICFYHADMQKKADQRLEIEKDLRSALAQQQFKLYYQPQFDLNGHILGAEALLRWEHPRKGTVFPAEFIAIAEETGLILSIGAWVLREACRQIKQWPALPHLSINISPRDFRQTDFIERLKKIFADAGASPQHLILELTENCLIENTEANIAKMKTLQQMNIGISIDDFGTGYSSLAYLKSLPLNQLKIDQSFIRDICIDQNDAVIVETIILMAGSLGLNVIAEGVENEAQFLFLKQRGCTVFQGYFFSKPLAAEDFGVLLQSGKNADGVVLPL
jgi:diguanylate cyclase (GGDEF)-like protein